MPFAQIPDYDYDIPELEASTASFASLEDIESIAIKSRPATETRIKSPGGALHYWSIPIRL